MARTLLATVEPPRPCSYLPDREASLAYRVLVDVSPAEHEALLAQGWRHFGATYFRPVCASCRQCVSLRIPAATFAPSRSQKRARKKSLRFEVGPAQVDSARLALYHAWHNQREGSRGWEPMPMTRRDYARDFALSQGFGREVAYWDDEAQGGPRLVAVGHCDVTPWSWSAIYFFYDPAYAHDSPGVAHVLNLLALAAAGGQRHVYLGYWIAECPSMRYKATFRPHELLVGRPDSGEEAQWSSPSSPARGDGAD